MTPTPTTTHQPGTVADAAQGGCTGTQANAHRDERNQAVSGWYYGNGDWIDYKERRGRKDSYLQGEDTMNDPVKKSRMEQRLAEVHVEMFRERDLFGHMNRDHGWRSNDGTVIGLTLHQRHKELHDLPRGGGV